ncbi:hypothetical protein GCM10017786_26650 [Amycolatopsis deserti]|uniref:Methyltransferase n=1 Tax=Amycolatopsis deserti TaxID=185696 RepID=A0ABQ3IVI4_9PSEU|nr:DUF3419 domain-containing protein [Amycolatopsis deserti]GHE92648.1 hypothetical protein GCM10017786_26650 [Amycolatopsis deserti]
MNPWAGRRSLLFGWGYEDPDVELRAFPRGRVLAIAAAGETVAALARAGFEVTGVDINPVQLAYCRDRLAGAPARPGRAERLLAAGRAVLRTLDSRWRRIDLREGDPAELLDSRRLRGLLATGLAPLGLLLPAFAHAIPPRLDRVLLARLRRGLGHLPADNPWAWRLLTGRDELAPDTRARATLIHADVADHLEQVPRGWYDGISLSNILDGPDARYAARLDDAVWHALRPGGVVVSRSFREPRPGEDAGPRDRSMLWGVVDVRRRS